MSLAKNLHSLSYTPYPRAMGSNIEEEEALQHSQLTSVLDGPEAAWEVCEKIGKGHLATGNKSNRAREYPNRLTFPYHDFSKYGC